MTGRLDGKVALITGSGSGLSALIVRSNGKRSGAIDYNLHFAARKGIRSIDVNKPPRNRRRDGFAGDGLVR